MKNVEAELNEYLAEIREHVCSRCIERPSEGPPCAPHGKRCGIELHLADIVDVCHAASGDSMQSYADQFHADVCSHCTNRTTNQCPCPLDYLLLLAIEAIDAVDGRTRNRVAATTN